MEDYAKRLKLALHRLEEQEMLVAVYKEVMDELDQSGQPSEVGGKMLQSLERTLAKRRADVARLSN